LLLWILIFNLSDWFAHALFMMGCHTEFNNLYSIQFMQDELDNMAKTYPGRFKIYYVLNKVCVTFFRNFEDITVSTFFILCVGIH